MHSVPHIGTRHIHLSVTDSTNNCAAELAVDLANAGTVISADTQSHGRGQHGRVWQSPPGANVLLSTLLFPPTELQRPVKLTAFAAVAIAETILQATGKQATIRWPNDLLLDDKKVCGILIEGSNKAVSTGTNEIASGSVSHFVVGIGLNVNVSADDLGRMELPGATSLSLAVGQKLDVRAITENVIQNLNVHYAELLAGKTAALEECWAWRIGKNGREVTAELSDGNEIQGQLLSLTFDKLSLKLPTGERRQLRPEMVRHLR